MHQIVCIWIKRKRGNKRQWATQSVNSAMCCAVCLHFIFYYYCCYRLLWINFRDAFVLIWKSWCRAWGNFDSSWCVCVCVFDFFFFCSFTYCNWFEKFRVANKLVDWIVYTHIIYWFGGIMIYKCVYCLAALTATFFFTSPHHQSVGEWKIQHKKHSHR